MIFQTLEQGFRSSYIPMAYPKHWLEQRSKHVGTLITLQSGQAVHFSRQMSIKYLRNVTCLCYTFQDPESIFDILVLTFLKLSAHAPQRLPGEGADGGSPHEGSCMKL